MNVLKRAAWHLGLTATLLLEKLREELEPKAEVDETEGWEVPPQDPLTDEARAMMVKPEPRPEPAAPEPSLKGSVADRVRRARASM